MDNNPIPKTTLIIIVFVSGGIVALVTSFSPSLFSEEQEEFVLRTSMPIIDEYTPPYVEGWIWIPTGYNEFLTQCQENNSCPTVFEDKKCGSGHFVIANTDYYRNPPDTWHFVTENTEKPKSLITDRQFCK